MYDDDEESLKRQMGRALMLAGATIASIVALLAAIWTGAMQRDQQIETLARAAATTTPLAESPAAALLLDAAETRIGPDVLPGHYRWHSAGATRTAVHDLWLERDGRYQTRLVTTRHNESDVQVEAAGVWRREGGTLWFTSSEGNPALFGASGRQRLIGASQDHLVLGNDAVGLEYEWVPEPTILSAARPAAAAEPQDFDPVDRLLLFLIAAGLVLLLMLGGPRSQTEDEAPHRGSK